MVTLSAPAARREDTGFHFSDGHHLPDRRTGGGENEGAKRTVFSSPQSNCSLLINHAWQAAAVVTRFVRCVFLAPNTIHTLCVSVVCPIFDFRSLVIKSFCDVRMSYEQLLCLYTSENEALYIDYSCRKEMIARRRHLSGRGLCGGRMATKENSESSDEVTSPFSMQIALPISNSNTGGGIGVVNEATSSSNVHRLKLRTDVPGSAVTNGSRSVKKKSATICEETKTERRASPGFVEPSKTLEDHFENQVIVSLKFFDLWNVIWIPYAFSEEHTIPLGPTASLDVKREPRNSFGVKRRHDVSGLNDQRYSTSATASNRQDAGNSSGIPLKARATVVGCGQRLSAVVPANDLGDEKLNHVRSNTTPSRIIDHVTASSPYSTHCYRYAPLSFVPPLPYLERLAAMVRTPTAGIALRLGLSHLIMSNFPLALYCLDECFRIVQVGGLSCSDSTRAGVFLLICCMSKFGSMVDFLSFLLQGRTVHGNAAVVRSAAIMANLRSNHGEPSIDDNNSQKKHTTSSRIPFGQLNLINSEFIQHLPAASTAAAVTLMKIKISLNCLRDVRKVRLQQLTGRSSHP